MTSTDGPVDRDTLVATDTIPNTLTQNENWVAWRYVEREGKGPNPNWTKQPVYPSRDGDLLASPTDPKTWGTFDEAVAFHYADDTPRTNGIGYVFDPEGVVLGVDWDDVCNPATETVEPIADEWITRLDSYTEYSPSRTGVHTLLMGILPSDVGNRSEFARQADTLAEQFVDSPHVEVYDEKRFFTVTGDHVEGTPTTLNQRNSRVDDLADEFLRDGNDNDKQAIVNQRDDLTPNVDLGDDGLIERAKNAENGEKFTDLYNGRWEGYSYPSQSEADMAYCMMLAFWTQKDQHQIDSIFRSSGLMREKWDEDRGGETYGEMTIRKACERQTGTYDPEQGTHSPADLAPEAVEGVAPTDVAADADPHDYDWKWVRDLYDGGPEDQQVPTKQARRRGVEKLRATYEFATPEETDELLVYNPDRGIFEEGGKHEVERELERHLGQHYTRHEVAEIVAQLKAGSRKPAEVFDAGRDNRDLLCVANGVLDLQKRELHAHSPEYLFRTVIPVAYDPDAECPAIEEFMNDITARAADRQTMYEMVGNCLTPHYDYESFMVVFGEGSNGKSTFFNVIESFLGEENVTARELQSLAHNDFAGASLVNKMANIAPDLPAGKIQDMSALKALTGGDTVMAEPKGQDAYEFENRAKLMFGANRPPVLGERTHAVARRLLPIELPNRFTDDPDDGNPNKRDRTKMVAEMTTDEELSGLLNKALNGLDRLRVNGDFSLPESPRERLDRYQKHSDPIKEFAITCVTNETDEQITKDALYNTYKAFCRTNDHTALDREPFFRQFRQTPLSYEDGQKTLPDEDARVRYVKHTTLTAEGDQYVPETVTPDPWSVFATAQREPDNEEATADQTDPIVTPLADVNPDDGFVTIEVEILALLEPAPWLEAEGTVTDETKTVNYQVRGTPTPVNDIQSGNCYRFHDVWPTTDSDGSLVLELRSGVTETEPLSDDNWHGQRLVTNTENANSEHSATTDGGTITTAEVPPVDSDASGPEADKNRILHYLSLREDAEKPTPGAGEISGVMADQHDLCPERTTDLLDQLQSDGRVIRRNGGFTTNI